MPIRGDSFEMRPQVIDKDAESAPIQRPEHTKVYIGPDHFEQIVRLKKLVEAADYLQHCRRSQAEYPHFTSSVEANRKRVERASDHYDYLRGQVKL